MFRIRATHADATRKVVAVLSHAGFDFSLSHTSLSTVCHLRSETLLTIRLCLTLNMHRMNRAAYMDFFQNDEMFFR